MTQLIGVEQPRKAETIACYEDEFSAAGILAWTINPKAVSISYGRVLSQSVSENEIDNYNTLEN